MLMAPPAIRPHSLELYTGSNLIVIVQLTSWESEMKKYVPFVFIAIMASLIGAKFAIAGEQSVMAPAAQVQLID